MKTTLLIALTLLVCTGLAADVAINGVNVAEYIHKVAEDSLSNYFEDQFSFNLMYRDFTFGMKFKAEYPKYDQYSPADDLQPAKVQHEWTERYIQYRPDRMLFKAGTLSLTYGSGMFLRAYYDDETDEDTRLEGFQGRLDMDWWKMEAIYGVLPNQDDKNKNDVASGIDAELLPLDNLRMGMTFVSFQNWRGLSYNQQDVYGGRLAFDLELGDMTAFDFTGEYGHSHEYKQATVRNGDAFYGTATLFWEVLTFTGGYKNYKDFDYINKLNDPPTMNYSEEPLSESMTPGTDEEGFMGEIRWENMDMTREAAVNYSEAWDSDDMIRFTDLYSMFKTEIGSGSLKLEYQHLEHYNENIEYWTKELKPAATVEFTAADIPILIKGEYELKEKKTGDHLAYHYEPLLQMDFSFPLFSFSILGEHEFTTMDDLTEGSPYIGAQITADVFGHTKVSLFGGKQKGGKVCRNGVCRYEAAFDGIKLEVTTRF